MIFFSSKIFSFLRLSLLYFSASCVLKRFDFGFRERLATLLPHMIN